MLQEIDEKLSGNKDLIESPSNETMKQVYLYIASTILPRIVPTLITEEQKKR